MGLAASTTLFPKKEQDDDTTKTTTKRKKEGKNNKYSQEWVDVVDQYVKGTLDPSYLHYPIRGSTVNAALLYPTENDDNNYLLPGTHKHLGGVQDPTDGCIYGVPANAHSILCLYPNDTNDDGSSPYAMKNIPLPPAIRKRQYKWLRGLITNGNLWAIPAWANAVLCVDLDAYWGRKSKSVALKEEEEEEEENAVQLIPLPENHPNEMRWQWHGGALNQEQTAIYCVPSNARHVLKVDIINKTTSLIDIEYDEQVYPDFTLDVANKWYGGIVGSGDNCIYGSPYRASGILRIDPSTDTAAMIGPNYGVGKYFWHGGIERGGKIYALPSHADTVLVIDTNTNSTTLPVISELPIPNLNNETTDAKQNYKWLGGAVGADGHIYCPACDTSQVLKINVTTDTCETFGFAGSEKNKWQGGILSSRDNCIYCIPANGKHVCRIATDPSITKEGEDQSQQQPIIQLIGDLPPHKDKWQGAAEGTDGSLYFIPENGYRVMRVTPPEKPPTVDINGKLPENDVMIELM